MVAVAALVSVAAGSQGLHYQGRPQGQTQGPQGPVATRRPQGLVKVADLVVVVELLVAEGPENLMTVAVAVAVAQVEVVEQVHGQVVAHQHKNGHL